MITFGDWLRDQRRALGLTQADVGRSMGVSQPTVSSWESGAVELSRADLVRVFEVLGVPESEWAAVLRLPRELAEPAGAAA
jgi:transcriptional regulator with XRE-family HTH domain